jgi:hypothetical protein
VAPNGTALLLMNAVGNSDAVSGLTVTFDDQAADHASATSALISGSFKPTNWNGSLTPIFPAPGPGTSWANPGPVLGGSATLDGTFASSPPNGNWNLYVQDGGLSTGVLSSGWSMTLTTSPAPAAAPASPPAKKKCKKKHKRSAAAAKKCKKKK